MLSADNVPVLFSIQRVLVNLHLVILFFRILLISV